MRRPLSMLAASTLALFVGSCRGATQITIEVFTDIPCTEQQGTRIFVGPVGGTDERPAAAITDRCDEHGRIGSLVVVPSGGRSDEVAIRVVLGRLRSPKSCDESWGPGCVLARRALHFVPHESLVLPIDLRTTCDGVRCPADQTCVEGSCRFARIDDPSSCTDGEACSEKTLRPSTDGGVDAGTDAPVDARPDADALDASDGAVTTSAPFCGDMSRLMAGSPWPMELGCPFHRGRSPMTGPLVKPRLAWPAEVVIDGSIRRDLVMTAGGKVIAVTDPGTASANITAVRASDGTIAWQHPLADNATGAPLLHANGNVYLTGSGPGGTMYAFDAETGIAVAGFPKAIDGCRAGLNVTRSGDLLGKNTVGEALRWNVDTGAVVWRRLVGSNDFSSAVTTSAGGIYYGALDGNILSLDETTGAATPFGKIAAVGDTLHIRPDGELVGSDSEGNVSFVTASGAGDGVVNFGARNIGAVTIGDDDTTYVCPENDGVWTIDKTKTKSLLAAAGLACSAVTIDANGNLFVACEGMLHGLRPDGSELWSVPFGEAAESLEGSPILGPGGTLYVGTSKGRLVGFTP